MPTDLLRNPKVVQQPINLINNFLYMYCTVQYSTARLFTAKFATRTAQKTCCTVSYSYLIILFLCLGMMMGLGKRSPIPRLEEGQ